MDEVDSAQFPHLGSLLSPVRDENGQPYQVALKLRPGGHGTEDLVRDESGLPVAWVFDAIGAPLFGRGGPRVQVAPPEVGAAAEQWLAELRGGE